MIQGPRVGTIICLGPPFTIWGEEQRTEERLSEPGQLFAGNVPSALWSPQAETHDAGLRD